MTFGRCSIYYNYNEFYLYTLFSARPDPRHVDVHERPSGFRPPLLAPSGPSSLLLTLLLPSSSDMFPYRPFCSDSAPWSGGVSYWPFLVVCIQRKVQSALSDARRALTVSYSLLSGPARENSPVMGSLGRRICDPVPEPSTWCVFDEAGGEVSTSLKYDSAVCFWSSRRRADIENARFCWEPDEEFLSN